MFHKTTTSIQIRTDDINNNNLIRAYLTAEHNSLKQLTAELILRDRKSLITLINKVL